MNKRINFEDNIFVLLMRIRMIRDIVTLDADPELFLEKILDDVSFADYTLEILLGYLRDNQRLNTLEELLNQFSEAEWQFSLILNMLLEHEGNIQIKENQEISEKIKVFRNHSTERKKITDNLCSLGDSVPVSPIVSSDELTELLKAL